MRALPRSALDLPDDDEAIRQAARLHRLLTDHDSRFDPPPPPAVRNAAARQRSRAAQVAAAEARHRVVAAGGSRLEGGAAADRAARAVMARPLDEFL
jgi:hypothetical protein